MFGPSRVNWALERGWSEGWGSGGRGGGVHAPGGSMWIEKSMSNSLLPGAHQDWGGGGIIQKMSKRENGPKNSLSGNSKGIWKFCQNPGNFVKTQGKHREFGLL